MPKTLVTRIVPQSVWDTGHTLVVKQGRAWSQADIWNRSQGILRLYGKPNWRDHTACKCKRVKDRNMPKVMTVKVGSRNRDKSAATVAWLIEDANGDQVHSTIGEFFAPLLDTDGDFYHPMIKQGLELTEGDDYVIVDSDGAVSTMKSAPEKVRKAINVFIAETLNVPTSVKVPDTGANVSATSRNWIAFRPRVDMPFSDETARDEYIERNR